MGIIKEAYKVDMIVGNKTYKAGYTIMPEDTLVKYEPFNNKTTPSCEIHMDVWAVPNKIITTFLLIYSPDSGKLLMYSFDD